MSKKRLTEKDLNRIAQEDINKFRGSFLTAKEIDFIELLREINNCLQSNKNNIGKCCN